MVSRISSNELRQFEPNFSSDFICWMAPNGENAPNVEKFNLIKTQNAGSDQGAVIPALGCDYQDWEVVQDEITVGPGITIPFPVYNHICPKSVSINVIDNYLLDIRFALWDWVYEFLKVSEGRSMSLSEMKKYTLKLYVRWFNRDHPAGKAGSKVCDDVFIILPPSGLADGGDSDFQIDSYQINFPVVGFDSN